MKRIKLKGSSEHDAFSWCRKLYRWKSGDLKYIKNKYRRRFRQTEKKLIKEEVNE